MSKSKTSPIQFIINSMSGLRFWFLLSITFVLLATLSGRVKMYLTEKITDTALATANQALSFELLWWLVGFYAGIHFLNGMFWRFSGFSGMRWITKTKANIHQNLFNYLSRHSINYFQNRFAGALANKISNVANGFESVAADTMWNFLPLFFGLIADLFLTYHTHYSLSLVLLIWMIIFIVINIFFGIWLKQFYYKNASAGSKLKGKIVDSIGNMNAVQTAPGINFERNYVGRYIHFSWQRHLRSWYLAEWVLVANATLITLFVVLMLSVSIYLFQQQIISLGSVVMIIAIIVAMERSLFFLGNSITLALQNYGQIEEGLDDILLPYELTQSEGLPNLEVIKGAIEFKNLSFAYDQQKIFNNLNINIKPGEKVGLVGFSGAGKSTLVNLLLRQYDLLEGSITIDGQDIASVEIDSLRSAIAYVPQSTELFHRSIYDNIRYGNFKATEEDVRRAAQQAFAVEFIESYPAKFHTFVGERGVKLSGGQRQRISIARAFLKNAPILLLDEATSALDSESEAVIQEALGILMKEKTVIAIAHRLSTLQMMDRILVIDQGQLVEDGTHQELLNKKGIYAQIWARQVSGFIQD